MRSNVSLEEGRRNIRDIISEYSGSLPNWNEADTRFHFIDRLLVECLGWPRAAIHNESRFDGEYRDYCLGNPAVVVWEAKRSGIHFDLPADADRGTIRSLESILAVSKETESAIRQAQGYCNSAGIEFAVVCNGSQLIAFIAQRIGSSWLKGKALVAKDLQQLLEDFPLYWQCLSPDGLSERRLAQLLGYKLDTNVPSKLSTRLLKYPAFRYKSNLQANLRAISELLLEDIVRTEAMKKRFYNECYCETGALSRDALISERTLQARYASLFPPGEGAPRLEPAKAGGDKQTLTSQILMEALAKRPIVLLGDVGVGKTSFLEDLIYIRAAKEFHEAISLYIDLGAKAALSVDLRLFVIHEIERQLFSKYDVDVYENTFVRGVYDLDIKRFKASFKASLVLHDKPKLEAAVNEHLSSLVSDKSEHLRRSIEHISKGRRQQIIFILDNADQRLAEIQQAAFIIAQEFAHNWNAVVFIAVRPQTFYQSKRSGALSAYPHKVFTIEPPRPELVIEKRLLFALKVAEGEIPAEMLPGIRLNIGSMAQFLKAILHSIQHNRELTEILANITGGNIRAVVEFVTQFIGSPNVEAQKIIDIQSRTGKYDIPIHEFSKAAILGDYSHYNPHSSLAMNLFDVRLPDPREHFLCAILTAFLLSDASHKDRDEFVATHEILEAMQKLAFAPVQTESALRRLTNKRLIETTERITFEEDVTGHIGEMPRGFRATSVGAYHLRRWIGIFAYLDAMVFDTPIFDPKIAEALADRLESFDIRDRLTRATVFRNYLTAAWDASGLQPTFFSWHDVVSQGQENFDTVRRAVERLETQAKSEPGLRPGGRHRRH